MKREDRTRENAARLAAALYTHSEGQELRRLAQALDYMPEQLREDIHALDAIVRGREPGEDD